MGRKAILQVENCCLNYNLVGPAQESVEENIIGQNTIKWILLQILRHKEYNLKMEDNYFTNIFLDILI